MSLFVVADTLIKTATTLMYAGCRATLLYGFET
jgi:hypothetical protein